MVLIPKTITHIWIGDKPAPTKWMDTWKHAHPDWEYSVFDQRKFLSTKFINQHLIDEYYRKGKYNGVADLIRYELLLNNGGFIPPADAVCFYDTSELWTSPVDFCYTVFENEKIRPGLVSPIYACNPENQFLYQIVHTLNQLDASDLSEHPWESTGNGFLKNLINQYQPKIKIFPSHYFIPSHVTEPENRYCGTDKIYAEQIWGSTLKDWKNIDVYSDAVEQVPPAKVCVYAICLNEAKHIDQFMKHSSDADLVLVCDTGSTDGSQKLLTTLGAQVHEIKQVPWRFDSARNAALELIPEDIDICLSIDLDEYLQPGWYDQIQELWQKHQGKINRIRYNYVWSWKPDGTPDRMFFADKIHSRHGYQWKHPCHETLYWVALQTEQTVTTQYLQLHHHADPTKSRSQYLPLLELAVQESPEDDRMRHYYARELMFNRRWTESIKQFQIHLSLKTATWKEERAASMRYMSKCYRELNNPQEASAWAIKATVEYPLSREPWVEVCRCAITTNDWFTLHWAANKCLSIVERTNSYITEESNWGWVPHDFAAIAAYYLGYNASALEHGKTALSMNPNDTRLLKNMDFYKKHTATQDT
jgi:hypothetical protein